MDDVICKNQPTLNWGIGIIGGHGARNKTISSFEIGCPRHRQAEMMQLMCRGMQCFDLVELWDH